MIGLNDVQIHDTVGKAALHGQRDIFVVFHVDVIVIFVLVAETQRLRLGATTATETDLALNTLDQLTVPNLNGNHNQVRVLLVVDLDLQLGDTVSTQVAARGLLAQHTNTFGAGRGVASRDRGHCGSSIGASGVRRCWGAGAACVGGLAVVGGHLGGIAPRGSSSRRGVDVGAALGADAKRSRDWRHWRSRWWGSVVRVTRRRVPDQGLATGYA